MEGREEPVKVVLIDSKTSFANRAEGTTTEAMHNGSGILSKMSRWYERSRSCTKNIRKDAKMRAITIEDLNAAAHIGGAGSLVMRQELEPASGPDGVIAPAKYTMEKVATYIWNVADLGMA